MGFREKEMVKGLRFMENIFLKIGKTKEETNRRLEEIFQNFFYGPEDERIYHEAEPDMGYLVDTGNIDVRTEGMSYGMMMCVQLDKKEEFDRIWKWAYTYMWQKSGREEGYFAWSCKLDGTHNDEGAAPDGEEFFAMALFFASHRWGDGEGIFAYSTHARDILRACLHKGENGRAGVPMWNHDNHQILFVAGSEYTDPSYHLPHFYECFAKWAYEEDREFFQEAAKASREFLVTACHPETGMNAEYSWFDGTPMRTVLPWGRHDLFYSDAYRTIANIGLDFAWNHVDVGQTKAACRLQAFLRAQKDPWQVYDWDGTCMNEPALHPVGMLATTAQASLAVLDYSTDETEIDNAKYFVELFWNTPLRKGVRRYYDNCLYLFAFLALSGNYKIW